MEAQINIPFYNTEYIYIDNKEVYKVYFNEFKVWPPIAIRSSASPNSAAIVAAAFSNELCQTNLDIDIVEARKITSINEAFTYNPDITSFNEVKDKLFNVAYLDLSGDINIEHDIECSDSDKLTAVIVEDTPINVITSDKIEELRLGQPSIISIGNCSELQYPSTLSVGSAINLESIDMFTIGSGNAFTFLADLLKTIDNIPTYIHLKLLGVGVQQNIDLIVESDGNPYCTFLVEGIGEYYKTDGDKLTLTLDSSYSGSTIKVIALSRINPSLESDLTFEIPEIVGVEGAVSNIPTFIAHSNCATASEDGSKLFDGKTNTKWLATTLPAWVTFKFALPVTILKYTMTTANDDTPNRNPRTWKIQGLNKDSVWEDVDTQTDRIDLPTALYTSKSFEIANHNNAYEQYRLYITASYANRTSGYIVQLSELTFDVTSAGRYFDLDSIVPTYIRIRSSKEGQEDTLSASPVKQRKYYKADINGGESCTWSIPEGKGTIQTLENGTSVVITFTNISLEDDIWVKVTSNIDSSIYTIKHLEVIEVEDIVLSYLRQYPELEEILDANPEYAEYLRQYPEIVHSLISTDKEVYLDVNQVIFNTEVVPFQTIKAEGKFRWTEDNAAPFGCRVASDAYEFYVWDSHFGDNNNYFRVALGTVNSHNPVLSFNHDYTIVLQNQKCIVNNVAKTAQGTLPASGWTLPILIGGVSNGSNNNIFNYLIGRIYYFKLYNGSTLLHHYVPANDRTLLDLITGETLEAMEGGTSSLVTIDKPEFALDYCVQCINNEYIDTGYTLFDNIHTNWTLFINAGAITNNTTGNNRTAVHCMYEADPWPGMVFDNEPNTSNMRLCFGNAGQNLQKTVTSSYILRRNGDSYSYSSNGTSWTTLTAPSHINGMTLVIGAYKLPDGTYGRFWNNENPITVKLIEDSIYDFSYLL